MTSSASSSSSSSSPNKKDDNRPRSRRSTSEIWRGFVAVHCLFGPAVLAVLTFIAGLVYAPWTFGMGMAIPYYTYILVVDKSPYNGRGARWPAFCQDGPLGLFGPARTYLNLKLIGNNKLRAMEAAAAAVEAKSKSSKDAAAATTAATSSPQRYILGVFPHGNNADWRILADGLLATQGDVLPATAGANRVRTLAATVLFTLPVVREVALWSGCVDAGRRSAQKCLQNGMSLLILPGGQQEQLRVTPGHELVYLRRRKGFCRLALQYGVPLVPVYVFGLTDAYRTSPFLLSWRLRLVQTLGLSWTIATGQWGSPYCPLPVDSTVVFGEPLLVGRVAEPTRDQVDKLHAEFIDALQRVFDQHKDALGYGDRTLEIM